LAKLFYSPGKFFSIIFWPDQYSPGIFVKLKIIEITLEFLFVAPTNPKRKVDQGGMDTRGYL
jgi:hypothetical protein